MKIVSEKFSWKTGHATPFHFYMQPAKATITGSTEKPHSTQGAIEEESILKPTNPTIIKLVNGLLIKGFQEKNEEIHFEPLGCPPASDGLRVRFRKDGVLYSAKTIPEKAGKAVIERLKILGSLDITQRITRQDADVFVCLPETKEKPSSGIFHLWARHEASPLSCI